MHSRGTIFVIPGLEGVKGEAKIVGIRGKGKVARVRRLPGDRVKRFCRKTEVDGLERVLGIEGVRRVKGLRVRNSRFWNEWNPQTSIP